MTSIHQKRYRIFEISLPIVIPDPAKINGVVLNRATTSCIVIFPPHYYQFKIINHDISNLYIPQEAVTHFGRFFAHFLIS